VTVQKLMCGICLGTKINVWNMPWIRNLPSLKPSTCPPLYYEDLIVNHLLNPGLNSWNHAMVNSIYNQSDAVAVLTTPLHARSREDSCIWKVTTDGSYTVKSAYRICIDLLHAYVSMQGSVPWQFLWNLKVPHRVRSFLWRLAHQCLPTRTNLINCGIPYDDTCVSCNLLAETHMHTFFVCSKAATCWKMIGIDNIVRELLHEANDFTIMLFDLLGRLSTQQQTLTDMTLWSLLKSCNIKLWESTDTSPTFIVNRAKDALHEWTCMQRVKIQEHNLDHTFT